MPTNTNAGSPLTGDQAYDAAQGFATTGTQGGLDSGVTGFGAGAPAPQGAQPQQLGPWLTEDDQTVFKAIDALVVRQERLARNRLEQDKHYTRLKIGQPFSRLKYDDNRDTYTAELPPGINAAQAAVPNKGWDLCNKIVETLMADAPQPMPKAENDSEDAESAAEMAEEFLIQDGSENGTNDAELFWDALDAAMTKASSFLHLWVDPTGGGYVPLQILAHPQAQSPAAPMDGPPGPDGQPVPTTDPVLRYITSSDPQQAQFTDDPSQAAPQWVPKIRADLRGREHLRCYPETSDVRNAQKVVVLDFCTLGELKRRCPDTLGQMTDDELGKLCDWTPRRYLQLLPPALRTRWSLKTTDGTIPDKGGSDDERIAFFYNLYAKPDQDYPRGCHIMVSGYQQGTILHKETWTAEIPTKGGTDVRCLNIPVVQIRPVNDPEHGDPMGRCVFTRFAGANESSARLFDAYAAACDIILHPASYVASTSTVEAEDIEESRATGKPIPVIAMQADWMRYEEMRPLPPTFMEMIGFQYEQMESIGSVNKPLQGADKQQEVSGVARQVAVKQAMISLGRMQQALIQAISRFWRIKLELAQKEFTVPQMMRYEGEDGAYKQAMWTGKDFAQVGDVSVQPGTGTMLPPADKINQLATLVNIGFMDKDEAADAARPAFSQTLGIPEDPHSQRVERQIASWLQGPPSPQWVQERQQYDQQMQQYQQVQQQAVQAQQAQQQADQHGALALHPHPAPQVPQLPPPPTPPWTPFQPLPHDTMPLIATRRLRRLATEMSKVRFTAQPPEWQSTLVDEFNRMSQAVQASQPVPPLPRGVNIQMSGDASTVGAEEKAATTPPQPQQQAA